MIQDELFRLLKCEATVSCVAHTREVSEYARRMPEKFLVFSSAFLQMLKDQFKHTGLPKKAPNCHSANFLRLSADPVVLPSHSSASSAGFASKCVVSSIVMFPECKCKSPTEEMRCRVQVMLYGQNQGNEGVSHRKDRVRFSPHLKAIVSCDTRFNTTGSENR